MRPINRDELLRLADAVIETDAYVTKMLDYANSVKSDEWFPPLREAQAAKRQALEAYNLAKKVAI